MERIRASFDRFGRCQEKRSSSASQPRLCTMASAHLISAYSCCMMAEVRLPDLYLRSPSIRVHILPIWACKCRCRSASDDRRPSTHILNNDIVPSSTPSRTIRQHADAASDPSNSLHRDEAPRTQSPHLCIASDRYSSNPSFHVRDRYSALHQQQRWVRRIATLL